ncbi:hypothetical protein [Arthrobacter psychrochitiniphilus]|uniref:hypothetical protein n=1 Tax=Arthrobacter psychrochitiniphilus TaxID=291045 RepID=UPI003F7C83DB
MSEQLREWWNSTYFDAMARQHDCTWLRLTADATQAVVQESSGDGGRTIQFSGELMGILSAMPPSVYASARYTARVATKRWQGENSQSNCNAVAYAISKFNEPIDRRSVQRSLVFHVSLVFAAALVGWFASEYWSGTAGWAAVVSIALVVLVATPVGEFIELHSMRTKKMKAFINIPGAISG